MKPSSHDPDPIPAWALSSETPYPCPCGNPMLEGFVVHKGEDGLVRLFHEECIERWFELKEIEGFDDDEP